MTDANRLMLAAVVVLFALLLLGAAAYYIYSLNGILNRIEDMLDAAIDGRFEEKTFEETRLSRLENRFHTYLSAGVSGRRKVEEEREKIRELVGDISHQTKTPLANIRLYSQLLLEQELPGEAGKLAKQVEEQSIRLEFLVANLVKISKLESDILNLHPSPTALGDLLRGLEESFALRAGEKGVHFSVRMPAEEIYVFCDRKWTMEALGNIVDNAVKYTPSGGKVEIYMQSTPLFSSVVIKDTGIGIPEEEQPRIFGRFYRGVTVRDAEGVGVGLYLAREIIAGQGGYIKVASKQGEGSRFQVCLPVEKLVEDLDTGITG